MNLTHYLSVAVLIVMVILTGCKQSLVISNVDYAQPVETVLSPDEEGVVEDIKNGFSFNIMPLQYAETGDTSSVAVNEVRYIRSKEGYYYITASDFRHVYIMIPEKNGLKLEHKILVTEKGIAEPALNQRESHIQLIDLSTGTAWKLNAEGIQENNSIASNERRRN